MHGHSHSPWFSVALTLTQACCASLNWSLLRWPSWPPGRAAGQWPGPHPAACTGVNPAGPGGAPGGCPGATSGAGRLCAAAAGSQWSLQLLQRPLPGLLSWMAQVGQDAGSWAGNSDFLLHACPSSCSLLGQDDGPRLPCLKSRESLSSSLLRSEATSPATAAEAAELKAVDVYLMLIFSEQSSISCCLVACTCSLDSAGCTCECCPQLFQQTCLCWLCQCNILPRLHVLPAIGQPTVCRGQRWPGNRHQLWTAAATACQCCLL